MLERVQNFRTVEFVVVQKNVPSCDKINVTDHLLLKFPTQNITLTHTTMNVTSFNFLAA
jgi:hypothetical protein